MIKPQSADFLSVLHELPTSKLNSAMFLNFYPKSITDGKENVDESSYKMKIVWFNVIALAILHIIAVFGLYLWLIAWKCQAMTFCFHLFWAISASFGITGGAHRLWAHRSYKANLKLRIVYATLMSMIFANDIYTWARDHRAHHKFAETNADPHNARRGFFFAHCGWLLVRRHPDVRARGSAISCADLEDDPVVMFHRKYYALLMPLGTFALPTLLPWYCWRQEWSFVLCVLRYVINIHVVWSLNSFAHLYGSKPYEKDIYASENSAIMYITIGEGFHNYHHVFPWDYKAAEFGDDKRNLTTLLLNWFARLGWAYELKTAPDEMIAKRALRTGDGSWINVRKRERKSPNEERHKILPNFWGWDDPDIEKVTRTKVLIK